MDRAEPLIREALRDAPNDAELLTDLALCLINTGQAVEARFALGRALQEEPEYAFAHFLMGEALRRGAVPSVRGALDSATSARRRQALAAEPSFHEALRLEPTNAAFHAGLARVYLQAKKTRDAIAVAEKGLALDPDDTECQNVLATALADAGRLNDAQRASLAALRQDPNDAFTHANRGWVLLRAGQHEAATDHFRSSLRENPGSVWARLGLKESIKRRFKPYRWVAGTLQWVSEFDEYPRRQAVLVGVMLVPAVLVGLLVFNAVYQGPPRSAQSGLADAEFLPGLLLGAITAAAFVAVIVLPLPAFARWTKNTAEYTLLATDDGRLALSEGEKVRMIGWLGCWCWAILSVILLVGGTNELVTAVVMVMGPSVVPLVAGVLGVGLRRLNVRFWGLLVALGCLTATLLAGFGLEWHNSDAMFVALLLGLVAVPLLCVATVQHALPAEAREES